jgi:hypothetical protein
MPNPSSSTFFRTQQLLVDTRKVVSPITIATRRQHSRPHFIRRIATTATQSRRPAVHETIKARNRNMSTPADHKPLKQAPKVPPVPRPSARYVMLPPYAALVEARRCTHRPKCSRDLSDQPNIAPPPRLQSLQLRICARLPWRCAQQDSRWRDTRRERR